MLFYEMPQIFKIIFNFLILKKMNCKGYATIPKPITMNC